MQQPGRADRESPAEAAVRPGDERLLLAATIIASAMAFIDGSVVTIALPAIQQGFGADLQQLQWVVNGYTLLLGALILVGGGLGDRIGRRRVFVAGISLFALASLACALAPSMAVLIAARLVQGVGAALLVPQSLAIISATVPRTRRGRAIGTWAAASAATTALGPPLGGFLVDAISWRAAFWINLPLSAAALWLTLRFVPESRERGSGRIDWRGAALVVAALGLLTFGLTAIADAATNRAVVVATLATGAVLAAAFVVAELWAENPLMPPDLFGSRVFTGTNIVTLLLYGSLSGVMFLLPFDLIARRGLTAAEAGMSLLPLGLIIALLSRPAGGLADRYGPRLFLAGGSLAVSAAGAGLALMIADYWLGIMAPVLLMSFGMAAAVSPLTTAVMTSVPDERSGAASGVNNAASRLAGLVAIAGLGALASFAFARLAPDGAVFGVFPESGAANRAAYELAFQSAYAAAMWAAAALAFAAAGAAWLSLRPRP